MDTVKLFELRLLELDPRDDSFPLEVDSLVSSVPSELHADLIGAIFRFFEKYPLEDCGAPGTLVHFVEHYYPAYKSVLLCSLASSPSINALLLLHRILNSELTTGERSEYLDALSQVAHRTDIHATLVRRAEGFVDYQNRKGR
jgi:hypothetical protein